MLLAFEICDITYAEKKFMCGVAGGIFVSPRPPQMAVEKVDDGFLQSFIV